MEAILDLTITFSDKEPGTANVRVRSYTRGTKEDEDMSFDFDTDIKGTSPMDIESLWSDIQDKVNESLVDNYKIIYPDKR
jgi:hypothetical protein